MGNRPCAGSTGRRTARERGGRRRSPAPSSSARRCRSFDQQACVDREGDLRRGLGELLRLAFQPTHNPSFSRECLLVHMPGTDSRCHDSVLYIRCDDVVRVAANRAHRPVHLGTDVGEEQRTCVLSHSSPLADLRCSLYGSSPRRCRSTARSASAWISPPSTPRISSSARVLSRRHWSPRRVPGYRGWSWPVSSTPSVRTARTPAWSPGTPSSPSSTLVAAKAGPTRPSSALPPRRSRYGRPPSRPRKPPRCP